MDPVTQGVLGACLPQSLCRNKKQTAIAGLFGLLAGMAPDLDVLIRSNSDPLLFLEYHRQFTHSFAFVPFGGFFCAVPLYFLLGKRWGLTFFITYLYCTLGYATHALLDACTSYGTQLFWPFSAARIAWNTMPVIDPIYTLPILTAVILAAIRKSPRYAQVALAWVLIYPMIGSLQRDRAMAAGWELAEARGHEPLRLEAKPSFGNLIIWKVIYETPRYFYVDAFRVSKVTKSYPGERAEKLDISRDFAWLDAQSQQAKDIERFAWFSDDYLAKDPDNANKIIDVRYSMVPNQIAALWGIELSPQAGEQDHVVYSTARNLSVSQREVFLAQLLGR